QENYLPLTLQQPTAAPVGEYRLFTEFVLSVTGRLAKKRTSIDMEAA
ncbi:hypothetical protein JK635_07025, partial [Neobacillus sp. YIM B02564]|nr:hypothetical protein [Neobacillus paridis]